LGAGGFATVYRAEDTELGREVALKVLHPHLALNAVFVRRFRAEARANARLRHPNIVTIFDVGQSDDGRTFLVMQLVEGTPLSQIVHPRAPLSLDRTLTIVSQLASALDYIHRSGLAHRDLKPSNVMITGDDFVTLMDFGIARNLDDESHLTVTGEMIGSPAYMAPEQISGGEAGAPADIYALGILTFELLAGTPPFTGSTSDVMDKQRFQPPPPLPDLAAAGGVAVARAIAHALSKEAAQRPKTAGQFLAELAEDPESTQLLPQAASEPISSDPGPALPSDAQPSGVAEPPPAPGRESLASTVAPEPRTRMRFPLLLTAGAVIVLVLALAAAGSVMILRRNSQGPSGSAHTSLSVSAPPASSTAARPPAASSSQRLPALGAQELLASPAFTVNTLAVGCHSAPNPGASVEAMLPEGSIQRMDIRVRENDGTWEHDAGRACWTRLSPGPLQTYDTLSQAITALTGIAHKPGEIVLRDDFADPAIALLAQSGDGSNYELGDAGGEYRIAAINPTFNGTPISSIPGTYGDSAISVDAHLAGPTANRYIAVGCRRTANTGDMYQLQIDPANGTFSLARWDRGKETFLRGWTPAASIHRSNETNSIQLLCIGKTISATINGTQVASLQDGAYQRGGDFIGAGVLTQNPPGTVEARFGHLVLTQR